MLQFVYLYISLDLLNNISYTFPVRFYFVGYYGSARSVLVSLSHNVCVYVV